jgi:signal transduction histidine kinase
MKVRTKFAVLVLVVTLVLSGVVYGQLELVKERAVDRVEGNVAETAERTADQIDVQVRRSQDYVGYYASRPRAAEFGKSGAFLDEFLTNPRFYAAQVVAANGTVVDFRGDATESVRRDTVGADLGDRPYVARPLETGEIHTSPPERVNGTGEYIVTMSAPIFGANGSVVGVLAAAIEVDEVTFFSPVTSLETEVQSVSVTAGDVVLHERHARFAQSVSATATVDATGWTVRVSRDQSPLNARLREMALVQGASLLLVLGSVVGLAVWEYRVNLAQTDRLLDAFAALRDGEYDVTPDLDGGEEWEQIREGVADLADGLAERETVLREREQRLDVLNRVLRHNLRNDLSVILNYADIAARRTDDDRVALAADRIRETGRGLVALGNKARRVEAAMEGADDGRVALDLADVVADAVAAVRDDHPDAAVSVDVPAHLRVEAMPALYDAVEEVCRNAVEHSDADEPELRVSASVVDADDGRRARLAVADDGPGVPEHERAVLTDGRETQLEHGSGLGLWLVYWVVEKSGGRLSFADREPRGSVVTLELPVAG